jgi:hypothetical protein
MVASMVSSGLKTRRARHSSSALLAAMTAAKRPISVAKMVYLTRAKGVSR